MAQIIIVLLVFFIDFSHLFLGLIRLAFELTPSLSSKPQKSTLPNLRPVILEELFF